jgi:membrane protein
VSRSPYRKSIRLGQLKQFRPKRPMRAARQLSQARFLLFFGYLTPKVLSKTLINGFRNRLPGLASEMAYSAILSLFPALLVVLTAIGLLSASTDVGASTEATFLRLMSQLSEAAPPDALALISAVLNDLARGSSQSLFSLSFIAATWTASATLSVAMLALDRVYKTPRRWLRPFWRARLIAIALTITTVILLILASFLVFVSDFMVRWVALQSGGELALGLLTVWQLFTWPLALSIVALLAAFIYRCGPSRWPAGTPIMPGAMLAALLWAGVSALFRLYVFHFGNYNRIYGAVGAVIILLLWLYLSSLALLLGAQLNMTVGEAMRSRLWATTRASRKPSTSSELDPDKSRS